MKQFLFWVLLCLSSLNLKAQHSYLQSLDEVRQLSRSAIDTLSNHDNLEAFIVLLSPHISSYSNGIPERIGELQLIYPKLVQQYGKYLDASKLEEKILGDVLIKEVYLMRFENIFFKVMFLYYKSSNGWILYNIGHTKV